MSIEKSRLSSRQLSILGMLVLIGDMALVYPTTMASGAKQDAWIAGLVGIVFGLIIIKILLITSNIDPEKTLIELSLEVFGKWIGGLVAISYLIFFLLAGSTYIKEVEDFLTTQIYENTPGGVIRGMAIILLAYGLRKGIDTLGRTSQIMYPFFVLFLVLLVVLLFPEMDIKRIYPILDRSPLDFWETVLFGLFYPFGEMCVFLMVLPYVKKEQKTERNFLFMVAMGALGLNIILFLSLTVLSPYLSHHQFYSTYILARQINIGNFLQRLEALIATAWIISTYFKTVLYYYAFVLGFAQLLKLNSYKYLIIPVSFLLYGLSEIISPNIIFLLKSIPKSWVDWDITHGLFFPLMLILVNKIRKRHSQKKLKKQEQ
ncbi:spore germination protein KB [Paenibacillus turicensis]|uniref:Spore germination protein KB n=1 Tax=Paenibacillus turicensis TaxID=160487 RepID=A0ABS4FMZ0_9BACL|nr:endospore germination permease [Paenibacillus turicensis]MBP1903948.1 spore germination protein KB [Paenibacillus turicensis]